MIYKHMTMMLIAAMSIGCPPSPTPPTPDADAGDTWDAGDDFDAEAVASTCANWCKRAAVLKCPSAQPTKKGATCVEVCTNVQTGPVHFNLKCKIAAKSCAAADACQ